MENILLKLSLPQKLLNKIVSLVLKRKNLSEKLLVFLIKEDAIGLKINLKEIAPFIPKKNIILALSIKDFKIAQNKLFVKVKTNFKTINLLLMTILPYISKKIHEFSYHSEKDGLMLEISLPDDFPEIQDMKIKLQPKLIRLELSIFPTDSFLEKYISA